MKEIKCPNCGASFEAREAECPYCGYINPMGAEAKYMRELEETRVELDHVDDEAHSAYRDELKGGAGFAIKRIISIVIVISLIVGTILLVQHIFAKGERENYQEELLWQQENFTVYDELYEKGEYEELMEKITDDSEDHDVWDWGKYDEFMEIADSLWGDGEDKTEEQG